MSVFASDGSGQCMAFYISGFCSSLLHGEITRVGGVQLQIYTGCHGAYCPAATFIYFLETPVGLE